MITKRQMPISEYTDKVVKKNGIYYKYLYPRTLDETNYIVCELSFMKSPTKAEINAEIESCKPLELAVKQSEVNNYDTSTAVNEFMLNEQSCWLDKATRVGLVNSITIEKEAGKETTTLYFNGVAYTLPVDDALSILSDIELYAIDCYRTTEQHRVNLNALTSLEDIIYYDYKSGYPQKLSFTI